MVEGNLAAASRGFAATDAGETDPASLAAASFGRITLAFERGHDREALGESLELLRRVAAAGGNDPWLDLIADATASRLRELVDGVAARHAFEDQLLALDARRL